MYCLLIQGYHLDLSMYQQAPAAWPAPSTGIRRQHRHRVWQHRLNAAPRGWCKQECSRSLLLRWRCSLQSPCGLRTLGVCLSPCCSIRAHLWQLMQYSGLRALRKRGIKKPYQAISAKI